MVVHNFSHRGLRTLSPRNVSVQTNRMSDVSTKRGNMKRIIFLILNAAVRVKATLWTCAAQMQIPRGVVMDNIPDGQCCEYFVFKR